MPKKPPRNAFYFYMIDFKEEQRKKGVNYANMAEVATAAGPVWTKMAPQERARYEARAKAEKHKMNMPEQKFTSTGVLVAEVEQLDREKREAENAEIRDIKNIIRMREINKSITTDDIYLMDVNCYCKTNEDYMVGECTVLRFNLEHGIQDNYHVVINPECIPIGYGYDVKLGCEEFGLEMPDRSRPRSNLMEILANIIDYLKQKDSNMKTLPPIFTMPEKVAQVSNFVQQMCSRAAEDETLFRIYKLDTLFFTLTNSLKTDNKEGFPRESLALAQLRKDQFKYTPELGCEMHELGEKSVECSKSRAARWAFTVLDSCCHLAGVRQQPGRHAPKDFDLASILSFKEQKRTVTSSRVAGRGWGGAGPSGNATDDDTHSTCSDAASSVTKKRSNPPLRMPIDYTPVRLAPAPLVSELDFPPLSSGAGRGRRNMSGEFKKMNTPN